MNKNLKHIITLVILTITISCSPNFSEEKFYLDKDNKKFDSIMHEILDQRLYKNHKETYLYYGGNEPETGPIYKPESTFKLWSHRAPKYITAFTSKNRDSLIFLNKTNKLWKKSNILNFWPVYKEKETQKYVLDTLNLMGFIMVDSEEISDTKLLSLIEEYYTIKKNIENNSNQIYPFNLDGTESPYKKIVKEYLEFKE